MVLNTEEGVYLVEVRFDNSFKLSAAKRIETEAAWLAHTQYQSVLVLVERNLKSVQFLRLNCEKQGVRKVTGSPLTNEGLVCAGGYSNEEGCGVANGLVTGNCYEGAELKVEPIMETCYAEIPGTISLGKLKDFLRKHYALPDKYRPIAYRYALKLPVSP
jgi:hypothetical protein